MSDTKVLLNRIAALRQRLEQVRRLTDEVAVTPKPAPRTQPSGSAPIYSLQSQVEQGTRQNFLIETMLRRLGGPASSAEATLPPMQLTARARRILQEGRNLLAQLRSLGAEPLLQESESDARAVLYRETTAMADTALRMVQAFPDAPGAQLRLCEGLEAILNVLGERIASLTAAVAHHRHHQGRIDSLAEHLADLASARPVDINAFLSLADTLLEEAHQGAPLRFHVASPERPAQYIAAHGLVVAQVMARLIRYHPDAGNQPREAVLAALVLDAGMLAVPADILCRPTPLQDDERRLVEGHVRTGEELAARLLPAAPWLGEAVACHHERLDGTGYPAGLRGFQIPPLARLLAICDVYAAHCASRPHRPARETRTALADTLLLAEKGALDRNYAESLLLLSFYPVGSVVELADGAVGVVVATHPDRHSLSMPARPILALATDSQGQLLPSLSYLDLAQCEGRSIVRSLSPAETCQLLGRRYPELL